MIIRSPLAAFGVALAAVAAAVVVRLLLEPLLGDRLPYVTLFVAVVFAAWYGGRGPALVALIAGAVAVPYFLLQPGNTPLINQPEYLAGLVLYGIVGFASISMIESLRKALQLADEKSEFLGTTLASIGDGVITTDAEGHVTRINAVAESLTGWSNDEATGQPLEAVFRIVNEQTRQPVENPATSALRTGTIVGLANHTILIAKDGTERPIDDSAAPIRRKDEAIIGCVLVFRDVTHRRQHERELEEREGQFHTLAESIPQLAWMANPDGYIFWYNRRWYDYTGTTFEQMSGWGWQSVHDPVELPKVLERWKASIAHGELFDMVFPLRGRDGVLRHFLTRVVPLKDGAGKVTRWFGTNTDITEQKQAEEKLRTSEQRFRRLADAAPVLVWMSGTDNLCTWFNKPWLDFVGRSMAQEIDNGWAENVHPEDLDRHLQTYASAFDARLPFSMEYRLKRHDGEYRWLLDNGSPFYGAEGEFTGYVGSCTDIDDLVQATARVRHAERASREILESITDAFVAVDRDWRFTYVNRQAERALKREPGDLIGRILWEEYPGVAGTQFENAFARGMIERVATSFTAFYPHHERWYEVHIYPASSGISIYFRDVSERERAEAELLRVTQASEQQRRTYETVLSNTVDFNYVFDLSGRFAYVNKALLALWGKELHEAVGKDFHDLDYPAEVAERLQEQIRQVIESKQPLRDETPYTNVAGERQYEYIFVPVLGAGGGVEAVAGSTRDITDHKRAGRELRQMAVALSEADRRKDEFLATLAHELRNPLAPVTYSLELMKRASGNPALLEHARSTMERQIGQMVRLVDDLLDLSRITLNKLELKREQIELASVVHHAVEASRPHAERAGHELNVTLPDTPIYLHSDPVRLAQVLGNLLNNACKYTNVGGRIWLTVELQGSEVAIKVRDTGVGIPPEMLSDVFDLFAQVDRSLERSEGGLGIGLSLAKRLVEMHGGTVLAHSEGAGRGSEFVVRLPTCSATLKATPLAAPPCEINPTKTSRILIVDDNRDNADCLAELLKMSGNQTQTAHDGAEAVEKAAKFRPEVILLDIGLPKMNGYEACRAIRAQPWGKDIVIVAQTGWGQEEDRQKSKEAGFNAHMVKPVDHAALMALLSSTSEIDQAT